MTFFQIPKILRARFRRMTSFTHTPGHISILDFYFDISEWHILPARAWTPALMLHLPNPCAKRKVLSLTKPKGKIYKTKSLHNYITWALFCTIKWFQVLLYNCSNGGGARGVIVIVVGNEHGNTSSNPGRYWLHFT